MGLVAAKCPSCGADIQLDDSREFGFCNFCGTKVMQDKIVVEHQGSVKVDNSEFVEKSLQNGRRALTKDDWEEVEKYYNLVEQNDPDNMEAVFFSSYGRAMLSLTDKDYFKREQKFNVLLKSISVISDYYETTSEDKEKVIRMILEYVKKMSTTNFVYNGSSGSIDATGAIKALTQSIESKGSSTNLINKGVGALSKGAGALKALTYSVGTKEWSIDLINKVGDAFKNELREISQKHNEPYLVEFMKYKSPSELAAEAEKAKAEKKEADAVVKAEKKKINKVKNRLSLFRILAVLNIIFAVLFFVMATGSEYGLFIPAVIFLIISIVFFILVKKYSEKLKNM